MKANYQERELAGATTYYRRLKMAQMLKLINENPFRAGEKQQYALRKSGVTTQWTGQRPPQIPVPTPDCRASYVST